MNEDWVSTHFKKYMSMAYIAICVFDFIIFQLLYWFFQMGETQAANDAYRQWAPITLQNGGFVHLVFGAILGISTWKKGDEDIQRVKQSGGNAEPA